MSTTTLQVFLLDADEVLDIGTKHWQAAGVKPEAVQQMRAAATAHSKPLAATLYLTPLGGILVVHSDHPCHLLFELRSERPGYMTVSWLWRLVLGFIRALLGVPPAPLGSLGLDVELDWEEYDNRNDAADNAGIHLRHEVAATTGRHLRGAAAFALEALPCPDLAAAQQAAAAAVAPAGAAQPQPQLLPPQPQPLPAQPQPLPAQPQPLPAQPLQQLQLAPPQLLPPAAAAAGPPVSPMEVDEQQEGAAAAAAASSAAAAAAPAAGSAPAQPVPGAGLPMSTMAVDEQQPAGAAAAASGRQAQLKRRRPQPQQHGGSTQGGGSFVYPVPPATMGQMLGGRRPPCEIEVDVLIEGRSAMHSLVMTATESGELEVRGMLQMVVPATWRVACYEPPAAVGGLWRVYMEEQQPV